MAIVSMTGFGRAETRAAGQTIIVEIRTVNHRFFEAALRIPSVLGPAESKIRDTLGATIQRGRASITIEVQGNGSQNAISIDESRAKNYVRAARDLQKKHKLAGELDINTLLQMPDILVRREAHVTEKMVWPAVEKGIERALRGVSQMRRREGRQLIVDLKKRLTMIEKALGKVEKRAPVRVREARRDLRKRLSDAMEDGRIRDDRLAHEIVILAERLDTTEEIVRARSHLDQFHRAIRGMSLRAGGSIFCCRSCCAK